MSALCALNAKKASLQIWSKLIVSTPTSSSAAQAHARFTALILDLQETVAAEAASLLEERLDSLTTLPWLVDEVLLEVVPAHYARTAYRSCLKVQAARSKGLASNWVFLVAGGVGVCEMEA